MDEKNAFLWVSEFERLTCPTPGAPCIPRRWRPQPPAHPERLHSTGSSAGRAGAIGTAAGLEGLQSLYHVHYDSSITGMVY